MSRAWRLSGQTAFESDLLEALSLLLLRITLGSRPIAQLIPQEEVEAARRAVSSILEKFLEVHKASRAPSADSGLALSTRERTVWVALRKVLIADWGRIEQLLEDSLRWISLPRVSIDDPEVDFLRQVEAIVASDLQSWSTRLRSHV